MKGSMEDSTNILSKIVFNPFFVLIIWIYISKNDQWIRWEMCSPHKILIDYHSGAGIRWNTNTLLFKKQTEQKTGEVLWREQRSAWDETNKPIASLSLPTFTANYQLLCPPQLLSLALEARSTHPFAHFSGHSSPVLSPSPCAHAAFICL